MAYQDLPKQTSTHDNIRNWVNNTLHPTLDKVNDIREHAAHKADLHDMGMLVSGLLLQIGQWRAAARQELAKAKASESRRIEQEARVGKSIHSEKVTAAEAKMLLAENLADWQYYVDLLTYTQDALSSQLTFLQSSMRSMREEEFTPQSGTGINEF